MWPLPTPEMSALALYRSCISKARPQVKARLEALEDAVIDAAGRYDAAATAAVLHTLGDLENQPEAEADRTELRNTYTQRMARKSGPGREVYEKIKADVRFGRCPLCGQRIVATVDHNLPKAGFPLLAVVPTNLVPACRSCNTLKGEIAPKCAEEQTIHPYFDDVSKQRWLFARVIEEAPASLEYFVQPPQQWEPVLAARVHGHFRMFELADLYGSHAAEEMSSMRNFLKGMDTQAITAHLGKMAESILVDDPNHWRGVMYQTLADSPWYTGGGFAQI